MPVTDRDRAAVVRSLLAALGAAGSTLAVAESLTGGLLAFELADAPGASEVFVGSVTAYTSEAKRTVLGVDRDVLGREGAVSPEAARQMARNVRRLMNSTYALATTGVAGPQTQDGQPVGTVYIAFADSHGTEVIERHLDGDRHTVQQHCVAEALRLVQDHLRPDG